MGDYNQSTTGHHALVFGASGILGWSIVDQILKHYPEKGVFSKVTALSNRPLSEDTAFWPKAGPGIPELRIVDGVDLSKGSVEDVQRILATRVPDIAEVTHIYYFAYMYHSDFPTESELNLAMLKRGFGAAEALAPNLQYVIFPTGTKGYGIHQPNRPFPTPWKEEMSDVYQPWHDDLFYYVCRREFDRMQQGKAWKWAEVRCGPVIGFVLHRNPYNFWALPMNFLSLYKFMHDRGHPAAASKVVPFPAAAAGAYHAVFDDGGQDVFAQFSIYLALRQPEQRQARGTTSGELFNIGDSPTPASMAERWPLMCSLFGLEGAPPLDPDDPGFVLSSAFIAAHADQVERLKEEQGVELQPIGLDILEGFFQYFTENHNMCLHKAKATGFDGFLPVEESFRLVFDRYVEAKRAYYGKP